MKALTRILTPLLVALMVLTSASLAVARAAPDAAGQMVLCTGNGPVVVHFDADGEPVGAPHYCPDCAMSLLAAVAPHAPGAQRITTSSLIWFETADQPAPLAEGRTAQARDPPLV
ncbi:MAG: hypothetical protein AAGK92_03170 [Pseudomonadota bacterium]